MKKLPVLATASRAYGFLLGEFGTIFRLAWAPLLIGALASYAFGGAAIDAAIEAGHDTARAMQYAPVQFLIGCIAFVTGIMALVVLMRVVIFGDRKPGLYVYVWLGGAELRLIVVTILLVVAFVAAGFASALVLGLLAAISVALPVMSVLFAAGIVALCVVLVWASLKLTLISPVVVAEHSLGVERSWELTRGNALRLLGIVLVTFLPYLVVTLIVWPIILGGDMPSLPSLPVMPAGGDAAKSSAAIKEATEAFANGMEQWQLGLAKAMRAHWLAVNILSFASNLVYIALSAGAFGSAYTALAGERNE